jgi:S-adenosylmethionine:diacylglycerol 3-amino-3-carboxypropyl transferase
MDVTLTAMGSAWARGRFDARSGPSRLLFGRMHEDASIELAAFAPEGRIFCIASAGCTAIELSRRHEVVAVDINPVQLAYARRRFSGEAGTAGAAERFMSLARALAPLAGWRRSRVREFVDLEDPAEQTAFWRRHLDTKRFRAALDVLLSRALLRAFYATPFLRVLPPRFGAIFRSRIERCISRHPNRSNPHARALLLGEASESGVPAEAKDIRVVHADAASFLEGEPDGSYDGFTLSNVLDAADSSYARRLHAAVRRAAAPGAIFVLRSFREPEAAIPENRAADDRSMLWGVVDVRPVAQW